jgi:hypothetical protein
LKFSFCIMFSLEISLNIPGCTQFALPKFHFFLPNCRVILVGSSLGLHVFWARHKVGAWWTSGGRFAAVGGG